MRRGDRAAAPSVRFAGRCPAGSVVWVADTELRANGMSAKRRAVGVAPSGRCAEPPTHHTALRQHAREDPGSRPSSGGTVTHVLKPTCHPCPDTGHRRTASPVPESPTRRRQPPTRSTSRNPGHLHPGDAAALEPTEDGSDQPGGAQPRLRPCQCVPDGLRVRRRPVPDVPGWECGSWLSCPFPRQPSSGLGPQSLSSSASRAPGSRRSCRADRPSCRRGG